MTVFSIVTPVYNDWPNFWQLVRHLDHSCSELNISVNIIAVDDGSVDRANEADVPNDLGSAVRSIEVVCLACNMGHQRAIAVGLAIASERKDTNSIVVMDCDGEDRPEDLASLFSASEQYPDHMICAKRSKRSERTWFRIGYWIYQRIFRACTGEVIDFGNYCLIPNSLLYRITHSFDTWNHLPASLLRSRLPIERVEVARGTRYSGQSKMKPTSLVVHGLSAIAVFGDRTLVRLLTVLAAIAALLVFGILIVLVLRYGTDLAIPGWATTVFGFLGVFLSQLILIALISALSLLNTRSIPQVIPASDALKYVLERKTIVHERCSNGG